MLGRWVVCPIEPASQYIILKIVGFLDLFGQRSMHSTLDFCPEQTSQKGIKCTKAKKQLSSYCLVYKCASFDGCDLSNSSRMSRKAFTGISFLLQASGRHSMDFKLQLRSHLELARAQLKQQLFSKDTKIQEKRNNQKKKTSNLFLQTSKNQTIKEVQNYLLADIY